MTCVFIATVYAYHTSLLSDWFAGANMNDECWLLALSAVLGYIYVGVYLVILLVYAIRRLVIRHSVDKLLHKMAEEATFRAMDIEPAERQYLESEPFKQRCAEIFLEQDQEGTGRVCLSQIKAVVLFDLTNEQVFNVAQGELFHEAFEISDKNHDRLIDLNEFILVVTYIRTQKDFRPLSARSRSRESSIHQV